MSSTDEPAARTHPVAVFARRLGVRLDQLADTAVWSMTAAEQREALAGLAAAEAQLCALRLRVLAQAETSDACADSGAADAAAWVAVETQQTRRAARSDLRLAMALEEHRVLGEAMAAGKANPDQARTIVAAVDRLPTSGPFAVDPAHRAAAEQHLVALAGQHDADQLRVLGRRVFEVIAPEMAEAFEGRALEAEEAHAARTTSFTMREDHHGLAHGRFAIPALHGQMLRKALQALTNPTRTTTPATSTGTGTSTGAGTATGTSTGARACSPVDAGLPSAVRDGIAFTHLLEAVQSSWLPAHGGTGATVVVTMTLDQLTADLDTAGVCGLDTGGQISAAQARRLACTAGIIPAVLGRGSAVLDAGTKTRFHTEPQRLALALATAAAPSSAATCPRRCATPTTTPLSPPAAPPRSPTVGCCAATTTAASTTPPTPTTGPNGKITFHRRT